MVHDRGGICKCWKTKIMIFPTVITTSTIEEVSPHNIKYKRFQNTCILCIFDFLYFQILRSVNSPRSFRVAQIVITNRYPKTAFIGTEIKIWLPGVSSGHAWRYPNIVENIIGDNCTWHRILGHVSRILKKIPTHIGLASCFMVRFARKSAPEIMTDF
jgi:hypothetical protein